MIQTASLYRLLRTIFLASGLAAMAPVYGQETWEKEGEGEIKDLEIELTKERQVTLPQANRFFEKVPPRPFEPIVPAITYAPKDFTFSSPNYVPVIRPLRIRQEELAKLYGNYLSAGFGNYTSFMVDGSIATKRDKKKMLGADFFWRGFGKGPVDDDHSAQSTTRINVFGSTATEAAHLGGSVNYLNQRGYFYGYPVSTDVNRDALKQTYQTVAAKFYLENKKRSDINYRFDVGFSRKTDAYVTAESEWTVAFKGDYALKDGQQLLLGADIALIRREDSLFSENRSLVRLQPAYQFKPMNQLLLTVGANIALSNDKFTDGSGGFRIFPHARADYALSDNVGVFAVLTGNMDKVNLHSLTQENFWLDANQPFVNTVRSFEFEGGIKASVGNRLEARLGAGYATLDNLYFYQAVRDPFNPSGAAVSTVFDKFALVYDRTTGRFNPYLEAAFDPSSVFSTSLRVDYFHYATDILAEAWHRPAYRADVRLHYNLFDKVQLQAGIIVQGGMKAEDPSLGTVSTLKTATDLHLKARYFLSRQISAFVELDNILANEYPIYFNYPARGFQGMAGVSWSF